MILKAPFLLPPDFLRSFGYDQGRRFVGMHWEACGDEAAVDDGAYSAVGLCDNWLYLGLVRRPDVSRWLEENGIHLGSSDQPARHWLVVDGATGEVYAAPEPEARMVLFHQRPPTQ